MSKIKIKNSIISNTISDDCDLLVEDFFACADGEPSKVKIIDVRDLVEFLDAPTSEVLGKVMFRCEHAWKNYCTLYGLPKESHHMLITRIKKKWASLAEKGEKEYPHK